MITSELELDRRDAIGVTLGTLTIGVTSGASAAPNANPPTTIRKAVPPRGCFGIVQPGIKRTAFLNAPLGMSPAEFQQHWIGTYASSLRARGARTITFNLIDKEHSPEKRFDAVTEMVFDSDWAYEREYLVSRTAYTEEAEQTKPSIAIVSRQIGIRDFDPGRPKPPVKRFGVLRRRPELTTELIGTHVAQRPRPVVCRQRLFASLLHQPDRPDLLP